MATETELIYKLGRAKGCQELKAEATSDQQPRFGGALLVQLVGHVTLGLWVVRMSPMMSAEII